MYAPGVTYGVTSLAKECQLMNILNIIDSSGYTLDKILSHSQNFLAGNKFISCSNLGLSSPDSKHSH